MSCRVGLRACLPGRRKMSLEPEMGFTTTVVKNPKVAEHHREWASKRLSAIFAPIPLNEAPDDFRTRLSISEGRRRSRQMRVRKCRHGRRLAHHRKKVLVEPFKNWRIRQRNNRKTRSRHIFYNASKVKITDRDRPISTSSYPKLFR